MGAVKRNKAGDGGAGGCHLGTTEEASLVKPYGSQTPKGGEDSEQEWQ